MLGSGITPKSKWTFCLFAFVAALMCAPVARGQSSPVDCSSYVTVTTANERSVLDPRTRKITSTADITIANPASSGKTLSSTFHAVVTVNNANGTVTMPEALGGIGTGIYGKYYYDLSSKLTNGKLLPEAAVTFSVKFVRASTVRFTYTISTYAVLPPANQPPIANAGTDQNLTLSIGQTAMSVQLDGSVSYDPDGTIIAFRWSGIPDPADVINPTVTLSEGNYVFALVVSDDFGTASQPSAVNITVNPAPNQLPIAAITGPNSGGTTQTIELSGSGSSDPDGDPLTYDWTLKSKPSDSAAHLSSATAGTTSFIPDWIGTYQVELVVNDGKQNSVAAIYSVAVTGTRPPTIISLPLTAAQTGMAYAYDVEAQDSDGGDVLAYILESSPTGMSIDPGTGAITWTPVENQSGVHQISVRVEDIAGLYALQTFNLTVSAAGECGLGAMNVCGRCVPFTPTIAKVMPVLSDKETKAIRTRLSSIELPFVANLGQEDSQVAYSASIASGKVYVTREGKLVYSLWPSGKSRGKDSVPSGWTLTETLVGSNPKVEGKESAATKASFFRGNRFQSWQKDVSTFSAVNLGEVWPGISMHLKAHSNSVEKVLTVSPAANANAIRLRIAGAEALSLAADGSLRIKTGVENATLTKPVAWQEKDGQKLPVTVSYNLTSADSYGFALGSYDPALPVMIDPVLQATYIGGNRGEWGSSIAVHPGTRDVYIAGGTWSTSFPGTEGGAQDASLADFLHADLYIARLSEDLSTLYQATYLGGSGHENWLPQILIHPHSGEVYISGITQSHDFPGTAEGAQPSFGGGGDDAFVARLNANLTTLLQSTYVGGLGNEGSWDAILKAVMAIHPVSGDVYLAAYTSAYDFPATEGGAQDSPTSLWGQDAFVARLAADLRTFIQSTYLGGSMSESILAIDIHPASGDVIVAGTTLSDDFPGTAGGFQESRKGNQDGFVACLNEDLTELLQSTYLGGNYATPGTGNEDIYSLVIHPLTGDLYVGGWTTSRDYPGASGGALPAPDPGPSLAGILVRMSPDLGSIRQATYLSGPDGNTTITDLAVHPVSGDIFAVGDTELYMPGTEGGVQIGRCGESYEGFVAKFSQDLTQLHQASYYGGTGGDAIYDLAIHPISGDLYIAGATNSVNITGTQGGFCESDPNLFGTSAFAARITPDLKGDAFNQPPEILSTIMPDAVVGQEYRFQVDVSDPNTHDCIWYWLDEAPAGLMINEHTGLITWLSPSSTYFGDNNVVVHIVDGGGLEDIQNLVLTLKHPPTKPRFNSTPVTTAAVGQGYNYYAWAYDVNNDPLIYSLDVAPNGMAINVNTSGHIQWVPTEADLGTHDVVVRATDPGGLFDTQQYVLTVKLPNRAPSILSSPVTSAVAGQLYVYDVEAVDPNADDVLSYILLQGASGMTMDRNTGLIQWTPSEAQVGEHEIRLMVRDSGGLNAYQTFMIAVMFGNRPPDITSSPAILATEDAAYTYDVNATDPDTLDTLTFSLPSAPDGMSIDPLTGLIQWLPDNADVGDHPVTVAVHDSGNLSDSQSFVITVANTNDPPVITSRSANAVIEGNLYEYQVEANDPDADDSRTYSLLSAPDGMSVNASSGLVQWNPAAAQVGYNEISLKAQDSGGLFDTQSYKLTVVKANHPPVITSTAVTSSAEGELYSYDVEAIDPDVSDVLAFALISAPKGMTIDKASGLIHWTPGYDQAGQHPAMVGVTDTRGLGGSQEFTVVVTNTPATTLRIEASPNKLQLPLGASGTISYTVNSEVIAPGDYAVHYSQTVSPDNGGLTFKLPIAAEWPATDSTSWVASQAIVGNAIGIYEITTTASMIGTGTTSQMTNIVEVTTNTPVLLPVTSYPDAIPISETINVLFSSRQTNSRQRPIGMVLEELDENENVIREVGQLVDDGTQGDISANDFVYSGVFPISGNTEGTLRFRTRALYSEGGEPVFAEVLQLGVTRFPILFSPSDSSKAVTDPYSGSEFISDEILVSFVPGTGPDMIESIIEEINGTVIGSFFSLGTYQVRIPDPGDASGVNSAISQLSAHSEVEEVEPNGILELEAFEPNDTYYASHQWAPEKIRADEVWAVARGGNDLIAVIDSGVDYTHQDLDGKVVLGPDLGNGDDDPMDGSFAVSHGTHVAGIAAARTNNDLGIAGISWNNRILAIKVIQDGMSRTSKGVTAEATKYAVGHGSKIINISLAGKTPSITLHRAIQYAIRHGVMVIVAAGNLGSNTITYPASYDEAFAVANTTMTDAREGRSSYGEWVDIGAPGTDIFSTVRNGNYNYRSGTSMAAPQVSGVAALMLAQNPELSVSQVRERITKSKTPLLGLGIGDGRVDAFEAVFNGSYEAPEYPSNLPPEASTLWRPLPLTLDALLVPITNFNPNEYDHIYYRPSYYPAFPAGIETGWYFLGYEDIWWGYANQRNVLHNEVGGFIDAIGPIKPQTGKKMAFITTGRTGETFDFIYDADQSAESPCLYFNFMEKRFRIQPGQTELPIFLWYKFVSEEGPATYWGGDGFQISVEIDTDSPSIQDGIHVLAHGRNYDPNFQSQLTEVTGAQGLRLFAGGAPLRGTDVVTGNEPIYQTDWQMITTSIPLPPQVTAQGGMATLRFAIYDTGGAFDIGEIGSDSFGVSMDSVLLIDGIEFK